MNSPPPVWKNIFLLCWLDMVSFPLRGYPIHNWHPQDGSGQIEWVEFQADSRLQQLIVAEVMWSFVMNLFLFNVFSIITPLPFWLANTWHEMKCWYCIYIYIYNHYSPTFVFCLYNGVWKCLSIYYYVYICCKPPAYRLTPRTLGELGTYLRWWKISKLRQLWSDFVGRQCMVEIRWVLL